MPIKQTVAVAKPDRIGDDFIRGFSCRPEGSMLEQTLRQTEGFAFAYERSIHFYKNFHTHDRPMFVFPRGASEMEIRWMEAGDVRVGPISRRMRFDASRVAFVPQGLEHDDEGLKLVYDTFAFYPTREILIRTGRERGLSSETVERLLSRTSLFPRTPILDQICNFILAKAIGNNYIAHALECAGPLLSALLLEALAAQEGHIPSPAHQTISASQGALADTLSFLETNLFHNLSNREIARHSKTSESVLQRRFQKQLGMAPQEYLRRRRLQEAQRLLEQGRHNVTEVALLVGYSSAASFVTAFHREFGTTPSRVKAGSTSGEIIAGG